MPVNLAQALRLPFLTGSLMPVFIVAAWAWGQGHGSWTLLGLTLLGVGVVHLGGNVINDFYDARGSDPLNRMVTPFSGGSRVIQDGSLSPGRVLILALVLFAAGLAIGLILAGMGRPWALAVGGAGLFGAWAYSSPPLSLMTRSLGEVVLFLVFGPVLTWGTGYVMMGEFNWQSFVLGLPTGWVITAVLWINQFPDYAADRAAGKRNLVVRLGTARARPVYAGLMLAPYPTLLVMVHLLGFTPWLHLGWISLPLAWRAVTAAWPHHDKHTEIVRAQALTIITHLSLACLLLAGLVISLWTI